jgi:hypothetical protein
MMDFWPTSSRLGLSKQEGSWGNKKVYQEHPWNSPVVQAGSLTAATLQFESDGRLSWKFAAENAQSAFGES